MLCHMCFSVLQIVSFFVCEFVLHLTTTTACLSPHTFSVVESSEDFTGNPAILPGSLFVCVCYAVRITQKQFFCPALLSYPILTTFTGSVLQVKSG